MSMFLVVEGLDFSGKSSMVDELVKLLNEKGYPAISSYEPGGTTFGDAVRTMVKNPITLYNQDLTSLTRIVMFNASRIENLDKVIFPALEEGKIVVCDRFWWSTLVYSSVEDEDRVIDLHKRLQNNVKPNFTFLCDLDYSTFIERRGFRGKTDELEDNLYEHFDLMRNRYLKLTENDSNSMVLEQGLSPKEKALVAYTRIKRRLQDDRRRTAES